MYFNINFLLDLNSKHPAGWMQNASAYIEDFIIRRGTFLATKEKIKIKIKGYDHQLVDQSASKIIQTAQRAGSLVSGPIPLPTEKQVITILRSTHINKDSREQFEMRTHKRIIYVLRPSNKTIEAMMGLDISAGVDIEIKL